ncbi:hypothetical protein [Bdellovibrio sp. HCB209]|uniref:hypothetical protein n=1 Tax=Bdellovibrio sp. HCB209 TaxID=3394354 RepID=UPI0039B41DC8
MKAILMNRAKKWMLLALIGCFAYFVGYIWGKDVQKSPLPAAPSLQAPAQAPR